MNSPQPFVGLNWIRLEVPFGGAGCHLTVGSVNGLL